MPKRISVIIGDLTFATQKEASHFIKNMLNKYGDQETVSIEDQEVLTNLIERHPEAIQKIGVGIRQFYKAPTAMGTSCFWLEREDGTKTDFSYGSCITGKSKTLFQEFMEACREAVRDDLIETKYAYFRTNADSSGKVPCAISGEMVTDKESHLDHVKPLTFQVIVVTFFKSNGINISRNMFTQSSDAQFQASFVDQEMKEKFRTYHHDITDLRIIKNRLNLKMGPSERIKKVKNSVPIKVRMKN